MLARVLTQRALSRAVPSVRLAVRAAPRLVVARPAIRFFSADAGAADQGAPSSAPQDRSGGVRTQRPRGPTSTGGKKETGTVKWFNQQKGYGFVTRDNGEGDVFVHFTEIVGSGFRTLEENQKVQFEVGQGPKGVQAQSVSVVS